MTPETNEASPRLRPTSRHIAVLFAWLAAVSFLQTALGCGGGGGGGSSTAPTPTPTPVPTATPTPIPTPVPTPTPTPIPAPTVSLTGNKDAILLGEAVRLDWSSANAASVAASNFGATGLSGSLQVTPAVTTTYTLTVQGPGGEVTGSFPVTVATVAVAVNPTSGAVPVNKTLSLAATVSGALDAGVNWSVQEAGGGTVAPDPTDPNRATYTAPARAGVFHVVATSRADPGKTATAEIRAQAATGTVTVQ